MLIKILFPIEWDDYQEAKEEEMIFLTIVAQYENDLKE